MSFDGADGQRIVSIAVVDQLDADGCLIQFPNMPGYLVFGDHLNDGSVPADDVVDADAVLLGFEISDNSV